VNSDNNVRHPVWLEPFAVPQFPDPGLYNEQGLVAIGGDLSPRSLTAAYLQGIFPWYQKPPVLWWSPDPRGVIDDQSLHISRSMRRHLKQLAQDPDLRVCVTSRIGPVMRACGAVRESTWITPEMLYAYGQLASRGRAHALEVRRAGALVGGLYGVRLGGLFAAESMFHVETDASKVALIAAVLYQFATGTTVFDVQFQTPHLASMGVYEISRESYLAELRKLPKASELPESSASELPRLPPLPALGRPEFAPTVSSILPSFETTEATQLVNEGAFSLELLPWVVERLNLL